MKKIFALFALMMVTVMGVKAQDLTDNYQRIYAGFNNFAFDDAEKSLKGFGLGYAYGANITGHNVPLFIEGGLEYAYVSNSDVEQKFHSLALPFNFTYKIGNEKFSVAPFIGETFRFGLSYKFLGESIYDEPLNDSRFTAHFSFGANITIAQHFNLGWRTMISHSHIASTKDWSSLFSVGYVF